jgi:hypothetical protein
MRAEIHRLRQRIRTRSVVPGAGMALRVLAALLVSISAAACAEGPAEPRSGSAGSSSTDPLPKDPLPRDQLYEGAGLVIDAPGEKPILCLGSATDSAPPICEGPGTPLRRWSWDGLAFDESGGTRSGTFIVRGTYIDGVFTTKEEPREPEPYHGEGDDIVAPCPEPEGGWVVPDSERTREEDRLAATNAAEEQPDHAGTWIDYIVEPTDEQEMQPWGDNIVLVLAFTGDPERHEAEAREHWGGALCIWINDHTYRELRRIQRDFSDRWTKQFGVETTWSDVDVQVGTVQIGVIVSTPEFQAELERRYGKYAVDVFPALHPVEGQRG